MSKTPPLYPPDQETSAALASFEEFAAERAVVSVYDETRQIARMFSHATMQEVTLTPPVREYTASSLLDLCKWLVRYGDPLRSAVYVTPHGGRPGVYAYTSEEWKRQLAHGVFLLTPSRALSRWVGVIDSKQGSATRREFTQDELLKFLEAWGGDVLTPSGLEGVKLQLRNLQLAAKIVYNKKIQDENNVRFEFQIEEQNPAKSASLPKIWELSVPAFEGCANCNIPLRLGYVIPRDANSPEARFYFEALTLPAIFEGQANEILSQVEAYLGGEWAGLIFRGEAKQL
ncbi:MAG: DUF2303 family protein [Candidatus Eisenbacteria bacterium]|nr:DUF2303 family protein [Candidatus Eisenbacteria bacterium]